VERIDWSTGHLSLSNGGSNNINSAKIVELYKPNYELDNFKIGGSMKESDFGCPFDCDDNFGSHYNIVYLKDLTFADMEYEVNFNGAVKAYFIITRLK
jgi:hypothetical protein